MSIKIPIYVFIDTNIIIKAGYNFHGGALFDFERYCDSKKVKLLTHKIVYQEVKKHICKEIGEAASDIYNFVKKKYILAELKHFEQYKMLFDDFRKQHWDKFIVAQWEQYLKNTNCKILGYNNITLTSIMTDYFAEKPPFESRKEKKFEFPDAIIIKSLINFAKGTREKIIVATDDNGWNKALKGIENIQIVNGIHDALNYISAIIYPEYAAKVEHGLKEKREYIIQEITSWLSDKNIDYHDEYGKILEDGKIENLDVDEIEIVMDTLDYVEENAAIVSITVNATIIMEYLYTDNSKAVYDKDGHCHFEEHEYCGADIHKGHMRINISIRWNDEGEYTIDNIEFNGSLVINIDTLVESERSEVLFEE